MNQRTALLKSLLVLPVLGLALASRGQQEPRVINPGPPPQDAIVLFGGTDLSQWQREGGGKAEWEVKDGEATVNGTGSIATKQPFGDCQLHIEWATPAEVKGEGQGRGNSGVIFQGRYELQVLDSLPEQDLLQRAGGRRYSQYAPLVNVSRKPGEWQSYDVLFHAPRFDEHGKLLKAATITVLHNGVVVQDHVEIQGPDCPSASQIRTASAQATAGLAGPRKPGPVPEYLDKGAVIAAIRSLLLKPVELVSGGRVEGEVEVVGACDRGDGQV